MMLRRSLLLAAVAMVAWSWSVLADVKSEKPSADPVARQRFVSLLTSIKSKTHGKTVAHDRQGDLRAFSGGGDLGRKSRKRPWWPWWW